MASELWTAEQEKRLNELLEAKRATQAAEEARFDAIFEPVWDRGGYDGPSQPDLYETLKANADAVCELLAPYRKATP